jgi:hypothetical protein
VVVPALFPWPARLLHPHRVGPEFLFKARPPVAAKLGRRASPMLRSEANISRYQERDDERDDDDQDHHFSFAEGGVERKGS